MASISGWSVGEARELCGGKHREEGCSNPFGIGVLPSLDNSIRRLPKGSPCDPASPLLGIHLKEIMGQESKDVYTGMFLSRLFFIVKIGACLNEL